MELMVAWGTMVEGTFQLSSAGLEMSFRDVLDSFGLLEHCRNRV